MAQCKYCGKKGFFLSVSKAGLCKKCAPVIANQVNQSIGIIKDSEKIVNETKNLETALSRYDTMLSHLKGLIELDQKGIPTIDKSPHELYNHILEEKNKVLEDVHVEVIDGYEFNPPLDRFTPLEALEHYREIISGVSEENLPDYGESRGIWFSCVKEDVKPLTEEEKEELEFLKKFRSIYEKDIIKDQKEKEMSALFEENMELCNKLKLNYWYLWELTEISGISGSSAEVLYNEGFKTKEDVKNATDKELQNIPGIGAGRLKQIRAFFSSRDDD